jgi:redox-sensitive bicupin YhaK (pirin superfamily)
VSEAKPYADPRSGRADPDALLVQCPYFELRALSGRAQELPLPLAANSIVVPLSGSLSVDGEMLTAGECGYAEDVKSITIQADATALLASFANL